jgi:hypothetical protein
MCKAQSKCKWFFGSKCGGSLNSGTLRTGIDRARIGSSLSEPRKYKESNTAAHTTKSTHRGSVLQEVTVQVSQDTFAREGSRQQSSPRKL